MKASQETDFVTEVLLIHLLKAQTWGKKNVFGLKKKTHKNKLLEVWSDS